MRAFALARCGLLAICLLAADCGGRVEVSQIGMGQPDSATSDGGTDTAATDAYATDADAEDSGQPEANPHCVSPGGFAICGSATECAPDSAACVYCLNPDLPVLPCINDAWVADSPDFCWVCEDSRVCVGFTPGDPSSTVFCVLFEVGQLYAAAGFADIVAYADYSAWTGEPVPEPTTCLQDGLYCGGHCGPCAAGQVCTGRSPRHPIGICAFEPMLQKECTRADPSQCPDGTACFVFEVDAASQPRADSKGYCLPIDACKQYATGLPGGGWCSAG